MNEDVQKRMDLLREKQEKREKEREEQRELQQLQEMELNERFETDLGPRGKAFDILSTSHGLVAIRRGDAVLHKKFMSSMKGEEMPTPEAQYAYVAPCVIFPEDKAVFSALVKDFPVLLTRLSNVLITLQGAKEASDRGKF